MVASRATLKSYFERFDKPTEDQFAEKIDSLRHKTEDESTTVVGPFADVTQANAFIATLPDGVVPQAEHYVALVGGLFAQAKSGSMTFTVGDTVQGEKGDKGDPGNDGADGQDGAAGPAGADGADGTDGLNVRHGSGTPSDALGVDGEFYIDNATPTDPQLWGPKAGGTWVGTGPVPLVGPSGADGADGAEGPQGPPGPAGSGTGAQIVTAFDSTGLSDGASVTMSGYRMHDDAGGPWTMTWNQTGRDGQTMDGGFFIPGDGADDYLEADDKTVAYVERFGAKANDQSFDCRASIQAAFDSSALRVEFGQGKSYWLKSSVLNRLQNCLWMNQTHTGKRIYGHNSKIVVDDNVLTTTTWIFQLHSWDGNGDVSDIKIYDLILDVNGANQGGQIGSAFSVREQVVGDKCYDIGFYNCHVQRLGSLTTAGTGFSVQCDRFDVHDCSVVGSDPTVIAGTTGFSWSNQQNVDTLEYSGKGSNLYAANVFSGFNWSGKQTASPQTGDAVGVFSNLVSFNVRQNKTQGPWDLVITGFDCDGNNLVGNGTIGLKISGVRQLQLIGSTFQRCKFAAIDVEIPSGNTTEHVSIINGIRAVDCGGDSTVSVLNLGQTGHTVFLSNAYIQPAVGVAKALLITGEGSVARDIKVVGDGVTATNVPVVLGGAAGKIKLERCHVSGTAYPYSLQVIGPDCIVSDCEFDKRTFVQDHGSLFENIIFTGGNPGGAAYTGSGGTYLIKVSNCNLYTSSSAVMVINGDIHAVKADFLNASGIVNTVAKISGSQGWITDVSPRRPIWADGPAPADVWRYADGTQLV